MKKITIILVTTIFSLFLLTSCFKKNDGGVIPDNTVGSFNIVGSPGEKAQLVVIGRDGKVIDINRLIEEAKYSKNTTATQTGKTENGDNQQTISITLKDGSCIAEVCLPGIPCYPIIIDPINDCPTL